MQSLFFATFNLFMFMSNDCCVIKEHTKTPLNWKKIPTNQDRNIPTINIEHSKWNPIDKDSDNQDPLAVPKDLDPLAVPVDPPLRLLEEDLSFARRPTNPTT